MNAGYISDGDSLVATTTTNAITPHEGALTRRPNRPPLVEDRPPSPRPRPAQHRTSTITTNTTATTVARPEVNSRLALSCRCGLKEGDAGEASKGYLIECRRCGYLMHGPCVGFTTWDPVLAGRVKCYHCRQVMDIGERGREWSKRHRAVRRTTMIWEEQREVMVGEKGGLGSGRVTVEDTRLGRYFGQPRGASLASRGPRPIEPGHVPSHYGYHQQPPPPTPPPPPPPAQHQLSPPRTRHRYQPGQLVRPTGRPQHLHHRPATIITTPEPLPPNIRTVPQLRDPNIMTTPITPTPSETAPFPNRTPTPTTPTNLGLRHPPPLQPPQNPYNHPLTSAHRIIPIHSAPPAQRHYPHFHPHPQTHPYPHPQPLAHQHSPTSLAPIITTIDTSTTYVHTSPPSSRGTRHLPLLPRLPPPPAPAPAPPSSLPGDQHENERHDEMEWVSRRGEQEEEEERERGPMAVDVELVRRERERGRERAVMPTPMTASTTTTVTTPALPPPPRSTPAAAVGSEASRTPEADSRPRIVVEDLPEGDSFLISATSYSPSTVTPSTDPGTPDRERDAEAGPAPSEVSSARTVVREEPAQTTPTMSPADVDSDTPMTEATDASKTTEAAAETEGAEVVSPVEKKKRNVGARKPRKRPTEKAKGSQTTKLEIAADEGKASSVSAGAEQGNQQREESVSVAKGSGEAADVVKSPDAGAPTSTPTTTTAAPVTTGKSKKADRAATSREAYHSQLVSICRTESEKLSDLIVQTALDFYDESIDSSQDTHHPSRNLSARLQVAVGIYVGCRIHGVPMAFKDVGALCNIDKYELGRAYKKLTKGRPLLPAASTEQYVLRFARQLELDKESRRLALDMTRTVESHPVLSGRNTITKAAAAIYATVLQDKRLNYLTKKNVCDVTGVSGPTLEGSSKLLGLCPD